jgi:hypothetical protein
VVPFYSETVAGFIEHHLRTPLPDLGAIRQDLPPDLIAVTGRMLSKNPEHRFGTTDELLTAVERLPLSGAERARSSDLLRRLARGEETERVRATPLSVLAVLATQPLVPAAPRSRARPRRRFGVMAGVGTLALALWMLGGSRRASPGDVGDPTPLPQSRPLVVAGPPIRTGTVPSPRPAISGRLRMLTRPADAQILIDGRTVGVGKIFNLAVPVGSHHLQAIASGFAPWDTTLVVPRDTTVSLGLVVLHPPGAVR